MVLNTKIALPVALGLSLVTVTAFVVYYVFKKDEEEETNTNSIKTSRINVIEINVPKSIVPALIGRSGSNIKEIEKKTGTQIHFKKFSDKDYDVCIVRGRTQASQLAETHIHEFIQQQPVILEDCITVPGWSCGRIIGTGGENINEISHRSGARVKIEGLPMSDKTSQRLVTFRGTKEQIDVAKGLVENAVAQEKCRREIEQSKRSPRHATPPTSSPTPPRMDSPTVPPTSSPTPASANERSAPPTPPASPVGESAEDTDTNAANIEVYVSAISSPSRFWVQFVGPQVSQLDDLVAHMTEYYSNKENRAAHALSQVSVGQVVAAVFRHDGRWYRARVHDIRPNEFDSSQQVADVFYLDYGDSEYVATHELCELRADLLRLRFQAMECLLAGVRPAGSEQDTVGVTNTGQRSDHWHPQAIERFEELTHVARWKPLVSRTCFYKRSATNDGQKMKEIPGIRLFDVTDEGELDIGGVLIEEGWAVPGDMTSPRHSPPRGNNTPFGDLTNSKVLCMEDIVVRSASLPKDHKDDGSDKLKAMDMTKDSEGMTASKSLSGLEKSDRNPLSVSNFDLSYTDKILKPQLNGSHDTFLHNERIIDKEGSMETLVPLTNPTSITNSPNLTKAQEDQFKANINRIDSHHSNLESLGSQQALHNVSK